MVLVEPNDPLKLFDIENLVTIDAGKGEKEVIGFVFELVGPTRYNYISLLRRTHVHYPKISFRL